MRSRFESSAWMATLLALLLSAGSPILAWMGESTEDRAHARIVRSLEIECDDEADDCAEQVEILSLGHGDWTEDGGSRVISIGNGHDAHHVRIIHSLHGGEGGYLGVRLTDLTPQLRTHFGVDEKTGVMIAKVEADSAAFRAGLEVGDIVTAIDDASIGSTRDMVHVIRDHLDGDTINLEIWRDGSYQTIAATLDDHPSPHRMASHGLDIDCGDDGEDCACTLNGESLECNKIPGFVRMYD